MPEVKEERPSYVEFRKEAVEDRDASIKMGRYMTKDVVMAIITPQGTKDRIPRVAEEWFEMLRQRVNEKRMPLAFLQLYERTYEAWLKGEEIPLNGTPIKGWSAISPAQQQNVISANILTLEDLAQANAETLQRIGMGGLDLKNKAIAWLKSASEHGKITQEHAALQSENATLKAQLAAAREKLKDLTLEVESFRAAAAATKQKAA